MGTISEEIVKEAPIPKRTQAKELYKAPEEFKVLEPDEKLTAESNFLAEEKGEQFAEVRHADINKERQETGFALKKNQEAIDSAIDEDKYAILQERQRNLYLKSNDLLLEREATNNYRATRDAGGNAEAGVLDQVASTPGTGRTFGNIESREAALYNRISSDMFELKEGLRTKWLGFKQDTELASDVIRYLKDGKIKNEARLSEVKQIAEQWTKAADKIKSLRNRAGGDVGNLEDWVIPQSHDKRKMIKAGYETWKKSIITKLDVARITQEQGGNIDDILFSSYKNITARKVETSGATSSGKKLADNGRESRVLHFKTGDNILDYNKEFGNPDIFSTMDSHVRQQSNEIAQMQLFGSNPEATFQKLKELAREDGMGSIAEGHLDAAWKLSSGQADGDDIISKLDAVVAATSGTHRAIKIASLLGSATVSSLADLSSIIVGSGYRGLSSVKIMGKGLNTLLDEATSVGKVANNVKIANRIGVVSEFASASLANSRYAEVGTGVAQRAAETVIRGSGLGSYTNSMRVSMGLELAGNFAENFGKSIDDTPFAGLLKEYGISSSEWDIIRKSKVHKAKGAEFMDTNAIYDLDEALGYKVSEMITNEMDAFVTMPTNRTRIWTTWGAKKGTLKGEAARSMMLFKSFPIAMTLIHMKRLGKIDSKAGKLAYSAKVIGVNMVMGGITLWAYDTITGKTVRSADRLSMIPESLAKSGGLGIFGDLVLSEGKDRYGHSWASTVIGVPAGTLEDIGKTLYEVSTDPFSPKTRANAYNRAKNYIPGQNLWYTRAVVERTLGAFVGEMVDPNYRKKQRKRNKAMRVRSQKLLFDN